ncbi:hypothetical protein V5F77_22675 [Xanthobacter sp. DSM 24535]|uniref:hypothetical protein n=1 Tax=Roseixanthobacter psychrophilus TaxID=3119917 RepID=UPI00372C782E
MKNPKTGELKRIKVGWSWVLFFFSTVFGIPLFLRRLYVWGILINVINFSYSITESVTDLEPKEMGTLVLMVCLLDLGLSIFFAIKGNELTAKNYLEHGWVFAEPDSQETWYAKTRWSLAIDRPPSRTEPTMRSEG